MVVGFSLFFKREKRSPPQQKPLFRLRESGFHLSLCGHIQFSYFQVEQFRTAEMFVPHAPPLFRPGKALLCFSCLREREREVAPSTEAIASAKTKLQLFLAEVGDVSAVCFFFFSPNLRIYAVMSEERGLVAISL